MLSTSPQRPNGERPDAKKRKEKHSDEVAQNRLCTQMEARLRTLEYITTSQTFLPHDHPMVVDGQATHQKYLEAVKAEGSQDNRGPTELQIFDTNLSVIASWLNADSCPNSAQRFRGLSERLQAMIKHGEKDDAAQWIEEYTFSPTFDQKKIRRTHSLLGQVVVALTAEGAQKLAKEHLEAWGGAATDEEYDAVLQRSPLETPPLTKGYKVMTLQAAFSHMMRERGGVRKPGSAPRGELAKQLLGRK